MAEDGQKRFSNRAIETAQVIEELIEMAKKFRAAAERGESLGLHPHELTFHDALATNESPAIDTVLKQPETAAEWAIV